ncbi:hypothetical protein Zmor_010290 [Zophobas morio]|uniref:Odorant receptor n=1 Tax=Zophobas morio TaxID=2755281 RepID=A0AA38IRH5_9CUCU|nr:hypothetical protein Zmor_010290 [Zophobas morio]
MNDIIKESFKVDLNVLSLFGLYISGNNSTLLKVRGYALYFFLLVMGTTLILINLIVGNDIIGMQMNLMVTYIVETMGMWLKVLPFMQNPERIKECINFFGRSEFAPKDQEEKKIIDECVRICHRNCTAYFYGVIITEIIWGMPILIAKEKIFPIQLWLPYDPTSSNLVYYVTLFYAMTVVVYDGLLGTVTGPLIGGLAYHATAQLKILKYNLQNLDKHVEGNTSINELTIINYKTVYRHLKRCIIHHNNILSFVAEYEECFSGCVFWQLAAGLLTLCFCCIGLTLVTAASTDASIYLACAFLIFVQLLFYCHYGTLLYEENNTLINVFTWGIGIDMMLKSEKFCLP